MLTKPACHKNKEYNVPGYMRVEVSKNGIITIENTKNMLYLLFQ